MTLLSTTIPSLLLEGGPLVATPTPRTTGGVKKRMVCYDCGERIVATIEQAKRHGWTVWVGGALCKGCGEREAAKREKQTMGWASDYIRQLQAGETARFRDSGAGATRRVRGWRHRALQGERRRVLTPRQGGRAEWLPNRQQQGSHQRMDAVAQHLRKVRQGGSVTMMRLPGRHIDIEAVSTEAR